MSLPPHVFRQITRENLGQFVKEDVWTGHSARANIKSLTLRGEKFIVKDFGGKGLLMRCGLGRLLLGHEWKIYKLLEGIEGIPRVHHLVDPEAFVMEQVDAEPIKSMKGRFVSDEFMDRLDRIVAEMHSRGVIHLDLQQRRNILITPDQRPYLVDFATAVYLGRSAFAQEVLIPLLGIFDRTGVLKIKERHTPHLLTDKDKKTLRFMARYRKTWIFSKPREKR